MTPNEHSSPRAGVAPEQSPLFRGSPSAFRNIVNGASLEPGFRYDETWVRSQFEREDAPEFLRLKKFLNFIESRPRHPYTRAVKWSGIKKGCVLDYGCSIGWSSVFLKQSSKNLTYVGADIDPLSLSIGSVLYPEADYLYLIDTKSQDPVENIEDGTLDLVIVSLINNYENCEQFLTSFLRTLKPTGYLHIETHTSGYTPTVPERKVMKRILTEGFELVRMQQEGSCCRSLEEFETAEIRETKAGDKRYPCRLVANFRPRR